MRHSKSHYYINPISGRVIKSTGKLYKDLKKGDLRLIKMHVYIILHLLKDV
jgi:hypothetical protein